MQNQERDVRKNAWRRFWRGALRESVEICYGKNEDFRNQSCEPWFKVFKTLGRNTEARMSKMKGRERDGMSHGFHGCLPWWADGFQAEQKQETLKGESFRLNSEKEKIHEFLNLNWPFNQWFKKPRSVSIFNSNFTRIWKSVAHESK